MKSTTETLSPTRVKLTIEVPFDEFKPELDKAYQAIGGQIQVPGFRKGKVPAAIVDQRVGRPAVLDEALNGALGGWYQQALIENKLQPLSQPDIDLTKFVDGEDIEVTAEMDVVPPIEVPDASAISVTVEDVEVNDADVDEQIDAIRERFATQAVVERAVADGDIVSIDLAAAHKDGTTIEEATVQDMPYRVGGANMLDGLDEAIIGLSAGEDKTFPTTLVGGELKDTEVDVNVKVNEVKEQLLPDLDEDFVQSVSEFDTVDQMRDDLRERLTRAKRMEQAAEARDLVLEEIIAKLEVPLPENLMDEEIKARREQILEQLGFAGITLEQYLEDEGQTAEEFDADLERRTRESIIARFLLDQVVADSEIGIDDNELSAHIMRRAQESGQDPNQYIAHLMEHNHVPEMVGEVVRGKALAQLVESAKVTDKSGNAVDLASLRSDGRTAEEAAADIDVMEIPAPEDEPETVTEDTADSEK